MHSQKCLLGASAQASQAANRWAAKPVADPLPKRVLIVEGDREKRLALKSLFGEQGLAASTVPLGAIVGREVLRCKPNLILINAKMPDQSGLLIACKLRLMGIRQAIWIYAENADRVWDIDLKQFKLDNIILYGGWFPTLVQQLRSQLEIITHPAEHYTSARREQA